MRADYNIMNIGGEVQIAIERKLGTAIIKGFGTDDEAVRKAEDYIKMHTLMDIKRLAERTRKAQKTYFARNTKDNLAAAMLLERELDRHIADWNDNYEERQALLELEGGGR